MTINTFFTIVNVNECRNVQNLKKECLKKLLTECWGIYMSVLGLSAEADLISSAHFTAQRPQS